MSIGGKTLCGSRMLRRWVKRIDKRIPTFAPESKLLTLWQLTVFAFVVTSAIVVPLMVAFETEMQISTQASLKAMDKVFDVAFLLDMAISMNIAFLEDGFLVRVRRLVVMKCDRGGLESANSPRELAQRLAGCLPHALCSLRSPL